MLRKIVERLRQNDRDLPALEEEDGEAEVTGEYKAAIEDFRKSLKERTENNTAMRALTETA